MNRREALQSSIAAAAISTFAASASSAAAAASGAPLWRWSAQDLAAAIRGRKISSREATLSAFERLDAVNPKVNAVVEVLRDEALAAADEADRSVRAGRVLGPLHGVPVTTKINVAYKGHPTTDGLVALKNNIATADSAPVRNFRKAGAVIVGRTNVPALSSRWFTENDLHGRTYNPWSKEITPGGSSGGAASAVAVGIGALAHGNDIGGSVRYPGYACGVPGIRASMGRIPSHSPATGKGLSSTLMYVEGVLGRSIADLRIGLAALSQDDPGDPWWVPAPLQFEDANAPTRVAMFSGGRGYTPQKPVAIAMERAQKALTAAGYQVEEVELPHFDEALDLWAAIAINEGQPAGGAPPSTGDARLDFKMAALRKLTPVRDLRGFADALMRRDVISAEWERFFQRYPVILLPNSWEAPFPWERDQGSVENVASAWRAQSPQLVPALLGLPGLSVPTGTFEGLPTGVQILARRFREDRCFAAGQVIERAHPMPTPIDPKFA